ncbi:extensin isoform X1 [Diachasma alloeum]|uniref:extensin isoform X1 n=1 Tax=Diachasma alloeum TaxID=454923 RepID=UPI000738480E|nr:extensin isoform X1 [Diachasma alloeum]XP_015119060.1 extensin isoform X1 [Diachasma alloeum]
MLTVNLLVEIYGKSLKTRTAKGTRGTVSVDHRVFEEIFDPVNLHSKENVSIDKFTKAVMQACSNRKRPPKRKLREPSTADAGEPPQPKRARIPQVTASPPRPDLVVTSRPAMITPITLDPRDTPSRSPNARPSPHGQQLAHPVQRPAYIQHLPTHTQAHCSGSTITHSSFGDGILSDPRPLYPTNPYQAANPLPQYRKMPVASQSFQLPNHQTPSTNYVTQSIITPGMPHFNSHFSSAMMQLPQSPNVQGHPHVLSSVTPHSPFQHPPHAQAPPQNAIGGRISANFQSFHYPENSGYLSNNSMHTMITTSIPNFLSHVPSPTTTSAPPSTHQEIPPSIPSPSASQLLERKAVQSHSNSSIPRQEVMKISEQIGTIARPAISLTLDESMVSNSQTLPSPRNSNNSPGNAVHPVAHKDHATLNLQCSSLISPSNASVTSQSSQQIVNPHFNPISYSLLSL